MSPPGADEPSDGDSDDPPVQDEPPESIPDARNDPTPNDAGIDELSATDGADSSGMATDGESGTRDFEGGPPATRLNEPGASLGESADDASDEDDGFGFREFAYDMLSSVLAVVMVGVFLFAVSGVWPPLVAVESPSMDPHMKTGDLVFVMDEQRFPGENAYGDTGVVTARGGGDYTKFQQAGDVIVFKPNGDSGETPIIHRAMFWVNESENWYEKANRGDLGGAENCEELAHCPADHSGFVTLGDNNGVYDQAQRRLEPVKPEWIVGTAELRIPALGWVRLRTGSTAVAANATVAG